MLTQDNIYGLNLVTIGGFVVMGIGLTLSRQKALGTGATFAIMAVGTVLVFLGMYLGSAAQP